MRAVPLVMSLGVGVSLRGLGKGAGSEIYPQEMPEKFDSKVSCGILRAEIEG
jgi:hypothetical protein